MFQRRFLIGYHYTSWQCWQKIKKDGLQPYPISKEGFKDIFKSETVMGVWLWKKKHFGISHIGNLFYQVSRKHTLKIVQLKIKYKDEEILRAPCGRNVKISHQGHIEGFQYHDLSEQSAISKVSIMPNRISVLKIFDLEKRLK